MFDYSISPELKELVSKITCNFIDARTTSKDYVSNVAEVYRVSGQFDDGILLSTCLRFEIYQFSGQVTLRQPLLLTGGITCVRRLLSIMTGLQSEIVGEREILMQVANSISDAFERKRISGTEYWGLQSLLKISQQIRTACSIETDENYSTVGADLLRKYIHRYPNVTVLVIGGGYMSEAFLRAIDIKLPKLIWANRDTSKLKKKIGRLSNFLNSDVIFCDLEQVRDHLKTADITYCAISNSAYLFKDAEIKKGSVIIDVSYPQVFVEQVGLELINISNTYFDKLVKNPILKSNITIANREIDKVISKITS